MAWLSYLPLPGMLFVGLFLALERLWPARKDPGQPVINVGVWAFRHFSSMLALPVVSGAALTAARALDLPSLHARDWPLPLAVVAYFLVMDLGEYLFHRAQHAVPWMWRMHSLHHSDPCMSALTTERHYWAEVYLKAVFIWPLVTIVLAPPGVAIGLFAAVGAYHVFIHSNLKVSFGPLSWLLNGPAYHRRHHGRASEFYNCNFAAFFPIWDVLCGSYRRPDGYPETGLHETPANVGQALLWPFRSTPREETASDGVAAV